MSCVRCTQYAAQGDALRAGAEAKRIALRGGDAAAFTTDGHSALTAGVVAGSPETVRAVLSAGGCSSLNLLKAGALADQRIPLANGGWGPTAGQKAARAVLAAGLSRAGALEGGVVPREVAMGHVQPSARGKPEVQARAPLDMGSAGPNSRELVENFQLAARQAIGEDALAKSLEDQDWGGIRESMAIAQGKIFVDAFLELYGHGWVSSV